MAGRSTYINNHFRDPHVGGVVAISRLSRGLLELRQTRLLSRFAEVVY